MIADGTGRNPAWSRTPRDIGKRMERKVGRAPKGIDKF